ncbi:MAG: hypothetical protein FJY82_01750 [Candidatus Aminicenantes bacterium]|nr:hypothetical protein [Candidatus Aminicenantes bacterium]
MIIGPALAVGFALGGQTLTVPAPAAAKDGCATCHPDARLEGSIHAGLSCLDCHAGAKLQAGDPPHPAKKDLPPPDCASKCHRGEAASAGAPPLAYADSVHGRGYLDRGEPEVARCWDCHGKHTIKAGSDPASMVNRVNIPTTCSRCHEDMTVVVKYNIHAESPYREYRKSVHGRALFDKGLVSFAAVCTDCQGVHDIPPAADPKSTVHPANLAQTCGQTNCHPGMPARIASAKIHRDVFDKSSGAPYYVQKVLFWLVIISAVSTVLWFIPALLRRLKGCPRR